MLFHKKLTTQLDPSGLFLKYMRTAICCVEMWLGVRIRHMQKVRKHLCLLPVQKKSCIITFNFNKKVDHDAKPSRQKIS